MTQKNYQWIASVYFFQSIPFVVVNVIAIIMYQQQGIDNAKAALITSILALPWAIKPLFSPFMEKITTKKNMTVFTQLLMSVLFFFMGLSVTHAHFLLISVVILILLAMISSLHDIASDGLYLINLSQHDQTRYVALRSFFYQMGRLFIKGGLLILIGNQVLSHQVSIWRVFFWTLCVIGFILTTYHMVRIPEKEISNTATKDDYFSVFKTLRSTPKLYLSLLFIFLYPFSEAQMQKIIPLFLIDKMGLDLSLSQFGEMYGMVGSGFLMLGIFISGRLLMHYSLSRCMNALTLLQVLGHFLFFFLSVHPINWFVLYGVLAFNQLTVGLANGSYMNYVLIIANRSVYPMSMYTLCTALMALSMIFFGAVSGAIQQQLGYSSFFFYILIANLFLLIGTYKVMQHDF